MVKVRLNRTFINPTARQCLLSLLRRDDALAELRVALAIRWAARATLAPME